MNKLTASELRIGNWVKSGKGYYRIASIHDEGIGALRDNEGHWINAASTVCKPIPLTESILVAAGLTNNDRQWEYDSKYWSFRFEFNSERLNLIIDNSDFGEPIKYLHQLQNLIFSLCFEELPITTKELTRK